MVSSLFFNNNICFKICQPHKPKGPAVRILDLLPTINNYMRYQLYKDDIGNFLIVDSFFDQIISKVKNEKIAVRVVQKINKNDLKDRDITKSH